MLKVEARKGLLVPVIICQCPSLGGRGREKRLSLIWDSLISKGQRWHGGEEEGRTKQTKTHKYYLEKNGRTRMILLILV